MTSMSATQHRTIPRFTVMVTVIHAVTTVIALAIEDPTVRGIVAAISVGFFFLGAAVFMVAFVLAAARSRGEALWFGGVFFLTGGVVDPSVRRLFWGSLAVQVVVGLAGAGLAPFTTLAFGVLVPLCGLGFMALHGARWGEFTPRTE